MVDLARGREPNSSADSTQPEVFQETLLASEGDCGPTQPFAPEERSIGGGLLAPGTLLDDYEIVSPLGRGGMGQVYRVRHRRLDREFALKIISSQHVSAESVQRFEREMKAAGRTNHPNVILATDAGESRGWHYLVMELVPGTDLARLIKRLGPHAGRRRLRGDPPGRAGVAGDPRSRVGPSRHQAAEPDAHARRHGQGARPRPGAAGRRVRATR